MQNINPKLVAVVGAGGMSGLEVVKAFKAAGISVRACVHKEAQFEKLRAAGADQVAALELSTPSSVESAIRGADAIYFIPPSLTPEETNYALNAANAAVKEGIERFVYVSVLHPHTPTMHHHMRKAAAEAEIRHLPLKWTFLQPAMYAQMVIGRFGSGAGGDVALPYDPARTFTLVDLADLSAVAVKVLSGAGHEYAAYELAGFTDTMINFIRIAGEVRGVTLNAVRTPPEKVVVPDRLKQYPGQEASTRLMYQEYDQFGLQGSCRTLELLLGRPATSFEEVAQRMSAN